MIALIIAVLVLVLAVLVLILLFPVNISFNSVRSEGTIDGSMGVSWIIFLFIYSLREKELKIDIFGRGIYRHISPEKTQVQERERKKSGKMHLRDFLNMTGPLLRLFKDFIYAFTKSLLA